MDLSTLRNRVRMKADDEGVSGISSSFDDGRVDAALEEALRRVQSQVSSRGITHVFRSTTTFTTSSDEKEFWPLPEDVRNIVAVRRIDEDDSWPRLLPVTDERRTPDHFSTGIARHTLDIDGSNMAINAGSAGYRYALQDNMLRLIPPPTEELELRVEYVRRLLLPEKSGGHLEVPDEMLNAIIVWAAFVLLDTHDEGRETLLALYQRYEDDMIRDLTHQSTGRTPLAKDGWDPITDATGYFSE